MPAVRISGHFTGNRAPRRLGWLAWFMLLVLIGAKPVLAEGAEWTIQSPIPFQVVQREGFQPKFAHEHNPGGPALGHANVELIANFPDLQDARFEYRVVFSAQHLQQAPAFGHETDWAELHVDRTMSPGSARALIPAGGWYRLEVRAVAAGQVAAQAFVEPVGVGEVFVIAGQSYADGANEEHLQIEDSAGRVVACDALKKTWAVANDPQPNRADGGTIWPAMGNDLLPLARVPIGLMNAAVGGTSSRQWLPGEALHQQLSDAGRVVGRFRAVLWQQGESDVIEGVSSDQYVRNLVAIRESLAEAWGFEPPWLLAKSTLHPTVYDKPQEEGQIRAAIDQLVALPGFRPGPDTDILGAENRGGLGTRRHFSAVGQRRAGLMWCISLWSELNRGE